LEFRKQIGGENGLRHRPVGLDSAMNLRRWFSCFLGTLIVWNLMLVSGCDNPAAMNESTPNVQHITQGEFADQVTRASGLIVVDFYATWCGPCRQLAPILDSVAGSFTGKVKFFKVNVDESPGLAQNYLIQAMPTLIFFKNGKLVDHVTGLLPAADLKGKLDALVAGK